ncbi:MAG: patatin-like phospholipase family protein [Gemmatimonadales bacterium]
MRSSRRAHLLCVLALLVGPMSGAAQGGAAPATVGLALSGGSAKGIAHVGVLRELERLGVHVDVVAGTSMGAVIGAMYALGLSVDSIETVIADADWSALINDATPRRRRFVDQRRLDERAIVAVPLEGRRVILPAGAIVGSGVMRLLEHVMWRGALIRRFDRLPLPFTAVATNLETGEPVALEEGVLAEALRASTSVPGALEPILLDGRLLVDGALSRNLPATDARDLGADFVICSDVSEPIDAADELVSIVDVLSQLASLSMLASTIEQRAECDVLILPDVEGLSSFSFDQVEEWVERGEEATAAHTDRLAALAGRGTTNPQPPSTGTLLGDSVRIAQVLVAGSTDPRTDDLIFRELEIQPGDYVTRDEMEDRLSDIENTDLFGLVRYRLDVADDAVGDAAVLTVSVVERARDRLALGLRYDDERRAALLFTATLHNMLLHGAVARVDLRLGEETQIGATLHRRRGVTGRFGAGIGARWSQGPLVLPAAEGGRQSLEIWAGTAALGLAVYRDLYVGVEGKVESASAPNGNVAAELLSATGVLDHESLDRIDFPRSGAEVRGRLEWGISDVSAGGWFTSTIVDARLFVPLHERLTLDAEGFAGYARGADLPPHRRFFLGGTYRSSIFRDTHPTFAGFSPQDVSGRAVQVGGAGLRWEVRPDWFVRAGVEAAAIQDRWELPIPDATYAWSIAGGFRTRIGPVSAQVTEVVGDREARVSVSVGRSF